jgi:hypothetical protein
LLELSPPRSQDPGGRAVPSQHATAAFPSLCRISFPKQYQLRPVLSHHWVFVAKSLGRHNSH